MSAPTIINPPASGGGAPVGGSGTIGTIPKWATTSTLNDSVITQSGSNIGIGTPSPLTRLDVAGSGRATATASSALTGTADPTVSTTLVGTGTLFTTELVVGDRITVNAETRTVTAIASATSLTVDTAFTDTASAAITRLPAILTTRLSSNAIGLVQNDLGNVGIGTASPGTPLEVSGAGNSLFRLTTTASGGAVYQSFNAPSATSYIGQEASTGGSLVTGALGYALIIRPISGKAIQFGKGDGTSANTTFLDNGNVGIGTPSPGTKTEISGDSGVSAGGSTPIALRISATDTDGGTGTWSLTSPFTALQFYSADTSGSGASVRAQVGAVMETLSGSYSALALYTHQAGTPLERMRVSSNGNVGIGTPGPGTDLDIIKTTAGYVIGRVRNNDAGSGSYAMQVVNAYGNAWGMRIGSIAANINRLDFVEDAGGANTPRLSIAVGGNVGIGTTSPTGLLHVVGGTAAAATNGAPVTIIAQSGGTGNTNGGNIVLTPGALSGVGSAGVADLSGPTGTGLKLPATPGNADSQTLDCYAEGTWTPTLAGFVTNTPGSMLASYTRVGRMVTLSVYLYAGGSSFGSTLGTTTVTVPPGMTPNFYGVGQGGLSRTTSSTAHVIAYYDGKIYLGTSTSAATEMWVSVTYFV